VKALIDWVAGVVLWGMRLGVIVYATTYAQFLLGVVLDVACVLIDHHYGTYLNPVDCSNPQLLECAEAKAGRM